MLGLPVWEYGTPYAAWSDFCPEAAATVVSTLKVLAFPLMDQVLLSRPFSKLSQKVA